MIVYPLRDTASTLCSRHLIVPSCQRLSPRLSLLWGLLFFLTEFFLNICKTFTLFNIQDNVKKCPEKSPLYLRHLNLFLASDFPFAVCLLEKEANNYLSSHFPLLLTEKGSKILFLLEPTFSLASFF